MTTTKLSQFSTIFIIVLLLSSTITYAAESRHQFTGQVKDATGLLYYNAHYYDPELRQFTQPDTVLQNIYDPQLLNRYAYARNNPLKYTDPSGNFIPLLLGVAVAATYAISVTSPYWMPYLAAYSTQANIETIQTAFDEPKPSNIAWAGLATWDILTPGLPEGKIAREGVEAAGKGVKKVKDVFKKSPFQASNDGADLVGSGYNKVKPTQIDISPETVQRKLNAIEAGETPTVRISYFGKDGPYITDGHHTYVAYNLKGTKDIPLSPAQFTKADQALPPFDKMTFQDDWSKTIYNHRNDLVKGGD